MENKKMTKKDYFNALLKVEEVKSNDKMVEFIKHEIELLTKKNTADRKPTKLQKENEGLKEIILLTLSDTPVTISQMQKENAELAEISNQKISALLRQLVAEDKAVRTEDKKKALFSLVPAE